MNNITFYRIKHNEYQLLNYVGQTKNLHRRKIEHKSHCFNLKSEQYNKKLYRFIRENNIKWEELQWDILLENECHIGFIIEKLFIQQFNSIQNGLNEINPISSTEDRREQTKKYNQKEKRKEYKRLKSNEYYHNPKNTDNILQKQKIYQQNNKDKIKVYKKEYQENNKEKLREIYKDYYINHKEKILLRSMENYNKNKDVINMKIKCNICNEEMNKQSLKRHIKRKHS